MTCSRVDEIGETQLLYSAQALERKGLKKVPKNFVIWVGFRKLDEVVNGIADALITVQ